MQDKNDFGQTAIAVDTDETFDPRSRSIAEKRAIGLTLEQIANLHSVSAKTVWRTLKVPEIHELVLSLQSEMYSESTSQLLSLLGEAVTTLQRLMNSDSDTVAARAASKVIDSAGPLLAHRAQVRQFEKIVETIESRLEEL